MSDDPIQKNILWGNKETFQRPKLINTKIKKTLPVIINKKNNSWYLNILLLLFFIIFSIFFLLNCRSGIFQSMEIFPLEFYEI